MSDEIVMNKCAHPGCDRVLPAFCPEHGVAGETVEMPLTTSDAALVPSAPDPVLVPSEEPKP